MKLLLGCIEVGIKMGKRNHWEWVEAQEWGNGEDGMLVTHKRAFFWLNTAHAYHNLSYYLLLFLFFFFFPG